MHSQLEGSSGVNVCHSDKHMIPKELFFPTKCMIMHVIVISSSVSSF